MIFIAFNSWFFSHVIDETPLEKMWKNISYNPIHTYEVTMIIPFFFIFLYLCFQLLFIPYMFDSLWLRQLYVNKWLILFGEHMLSDFWILKQDSGETPAMVVMMTRHILLSIQQNFWLVTPTCPQTIMYVAFLNSIEILIRHHTSFITPFSNPLFFMLYKSNKVLRICFLVSRNCMSLLFAIFLLVAPNLQLELKQLWKLTLPVNSSMHQGVSYLLWASSNVVVIFCCCLHLIGYYPYFKKHEAVVSPNYLVLHVLEFYWKISSTDTSGKQE